MENKDLKQIGTQPIRVAGGGFEQIPLYTDAASGSCKPANCVQVGLLLYRDGRGAKRLYVEATPELEERETTMIFSYETALVPLIKNYIDTKEALKKQKSSN